MAKNNKLINSLNEIARRNRSQNVATAADQMVPQIYGLSPLRCTAHTVLGISVSMIYSWSLSTFGRTTPETELAWLKNVRKKQE